MALKNNETGEYLKIIGVHFDLVNSNHHYDYYIFANEEQRQRFESGLSHYEIFKMGQYASSVVSNVLTISTFEDNIKNTLITQGYILLKNDMFNNWVDA